MVPNIVIKILEGDQPIGQLGPDGVLSWERPAGPIRITATAPESAHTVEFEAKPGKVYCLGVAVSPGLLLGAQAVLEFVIAGPMQRSCEVPHASREWNRPR